MHIQCKNLRSGENTKKGNYIIKQFGEIKAYSIGKD